MTGVLGRATRLSRPEAATGGAREPGWLVRLLRYCRRHRVPALLALAASVLGMGLAAFAPLVQRSIVDDVILRPQRALWPLAGVLVAIGLASYAAAFVRRYEGSRLALNVQHDLRTDIFAALSELDGKGQDELQTGQIVSRANSDVALVQGLLAGLPPMAGNVVLFAVSLVAMVVLSPLLTLVAVAAAAAVWWVGAHGRQTLFPSTWEAQQQAAAVAGVVNDAVAGVRVVKSFGQEEQELAKLSRAARRLFASRLRGIRLASWYNARLALVPQLGLVGVLAMGGALAVRGTVTLGTFLAFATYLTLLTGPVRMLTTMLTMGPPARAGAVRVFQVIDSRPQVTEAPDAVTLPRDAVPEVWLDGVTFGYLPGQLVLDGLTLRVRPGETLALVGRVGSGKSTVSLLLPRFYDPQGGAVRVAGHDVRELTLDSLRRHIGLVLEETFLFSESIRANIAYGNPAATREQVEAAARAAEAHELIEALPDGYDTVVGERGLTLSGGQRQRLSLARALLTEPRLLVLDDATSAVDARVEAEIHATLRRVMSGRTTLLIAHRRSTLALADRVAVLDKGRLVDVGSHDELRARCPLYRLLLSGPGEDAEGVDAGELPVAAAGSPWQRERAEQPDGDRAPGGAPGSGQLGIFSLLAPTAQLRAQVAALPPARDTPEVDEARAGTPDPRFRFGTQLRPFTVPVLVALVLAALEAVAALALPLLTRLGVDRGVVHESLPVIAVVSLVGLAVALAGMVVTAALNRVALRTGERLLYALRLKAFAQLQRLGLPYYEGEMSGRIMTKLTTDVDAVATFVQMGLITTLVSLLTFGGILVALVVINPSLALVVLSALPLVLLATMLFRAKSARAHAEAREKISTVNADLHENVAGLRVTQAYRRQRHNRGRFAQHSDAYRTSRGRAQRHAATYFPFIQLVADLAAVAALVLGARLVQTGALTAGELIAYLLFIALFFAPVQQLSQVFDWYQQAAVGLRRIRELLATPTSTPLPARPVPVPDRLRGQIAFEDVRLGYGANGSEALRGVTLTVEPGETVALVGETGAGKSSLVKLIPRLYDVTAGSVRVDGVDVRRYDLAGYRHRLGVVPQETYLFPGTVRDTICYGRPEATDAEVEAAARAAGAHEMVARLAGGYHHRVAEGGRNLSAGQRQLLALARAELVDPDIVLWDEATAALDLATEAAVIAATRATPDRAGDGPPGRPARTTLLVAHRLTTAAGADRIAVLDQGRIVEVGTHPDLLAAGGRYAQLWRAFTGNPNPPSEHRSSSGYVC